MEPRTAEAVKTHPNRTISDGSAHRPTPAAESAHGGGDAPGHSCYPRPMLNAFRECGWSSYVSLLLGVLGSLGALAGLVLVFSAERKSAPALALLALLFGGMSLGAGFLGAAHGRSTVDNVLAAVDESMREQVRVVGYAEASQCVNVATRTSAAPLLLGGLVLGAALLLKKSRPS